MAVDEQNGTGDAAADDQGPKVVTLKYPVKWGKTDIAELTFNRMKGRDLRNLPMEPNVGDMLDLAGRSCGQTPRFMDMIDAKDLMEIMEAVKHFLPDGLVAGDKS